MSRLVLDRRDAACIAPTHSRWARRHHGCVCPPSETERAAWKYSSRRYRAATRRGIGLAKSCEVDELAVQFAVAGDCPAWMTTAEREAAVKILTDRELFAWQIADRLRCNVRTVVRYRQRARRARAEVTAC